MSIAVYTKTIKKDYFIIGPQAGNDYPYFTIW